jgi:hypothetical protein
MAQLIDMIGKSCCYSFDDLFRAAHQRDMSEAERSAFAALDQPGKNLAVKQMVTKTGGRFTCEDRTGTDGLTYTAFWAD